MLLMIANGSVGAATADHEVPPVVVRQMVVCEAALVAIATSTLGSVFAQSNLMLEFWMPVTIDDVATAPKVPVLVMKNCPFVSAYARRLPSVGWNATKAPAKLP